MIRIRFCVEKKKKNFFDFSENFYKSGTFFLGKIFFRGNDRKCRKMHKKLKKKEKIFFEIFSIFQCLKIGLNSAEIRLLLDLTHAKFEDEHTENGFRA